MENLRSQTRRFQKLMTSDEIAERSEFENILYNSCELHKLAKMLTSDSDLLVEILSTEVGLKRVKSILGTSDDIDTILFYPILKRFTEIMTQRRGYRLAIRILNVCNQRKKTIFCHYTLYHALTLAHEVRGCITLKRVIALAEDRFKDYFLDLFAEHAGLLISLGHFGIYFLITHVLNLEFTQRTTEATRFHELMSEFDEILWTSDDRSRTELLHKLALKLTSDSDLFVDFIKTRRGLLMAMIFLGKSEEIDKMFFEAIKKRFIDVITDDFGYSIVIRIVILFMKRGNFEVHRQILRLIAQNALYLTKDPMGNIVVQDTIDLRNKHNSTINIACFLYPHFIELSFHKYGSNVLEKLLGESLFALILIVKKIKACDEDKLVRLAQNVYGNKVLKKTLEFARERRVDLFGGLVEKMKPFLDRLRGSQGENIAAILDSETETETKTVTVNDPIVSDGNN